MTTRVPDLLSRPWAITPEKFQTICEVYDRHASGVRFDVEGLQAVAGSKGTATQEQSTYDVQNGVAVIDVDGVLCKRANIFSYYSGGTSTQILTDTIQQAAADPGVKAMLLRIDSPGGEVDGVQVAAQAVAAAAKQMPVYAWMDGQCCSGAMWIASQASQRYIADLTTIVGSIGVVITHTDRSKANEQSGRRVTEITAGKYKRIASVHAPLTQDGRDVLQDQADQIYSVFVDDVAQGMSLSTESVLSDMADGRIFIGQQAIDAGLAIGVASEAQLISKLAQLQQGSTLPGAPLPGNPNPKQGAQNMSYKSFETESDYKAEIAAAEARGRAAANEPEAQAEALHTRTMTLATKIQSHIAKVKTLEGRRMSSAQALQELERAGEVTR